MQGGWRRAGTRDPAFLIERAIHCKDIRARMRKRDNTQLGFTDDFKSQRLNPLRNLSSRGQDLTLFLSIPGLAEIMHDGPCGRDGPAGASTSKCGRHHSTRGPTIKIKCHVGQQIGFAKENGARALRCIAILMEVSRDRTDTLQRKIKSRNWLAELLGKRRDIAPNARVYMQPNTCLRGQLTERFDGVD